MTDLVKNLLEYFAKTSREQQLKDWESISSYGEFGPDVFEYLDYIHEKIPVIQLSNRPNNPEFSLDFFLKSTLINVNNGTSTLFSTQLSF